MNKEERRRLVYRRISMQQRVDYKMGMFKGEQSIVYRGITIVCRNIKR